MSRHKRLEYAVDKTTGMVWSRCDKEHAVALPVLDFAGMKAEDSFNTVYKLEKFSTEGAEGHHTLTQWHSPNMHHTRKIPAMLKNKHREFWGMKPLGKTPTKFFFFEEHSGDDNDNSIADVVVEATTLGKAEARLGAVARRNGYKYDDNTSARNNYMKWRGDIPLHMDFYLKGEYDTIQQAEKERCIYHGYYEILKGAKP